MFKAASTATSYIHVTHTPQIHQSTIKSPISFAFTRPMSTPVTIYIHPTNTVHNVNSNHLQSLKISYQQFGKTVHLLSTITRQEIRVTLSIWMYSSILDKRGDVYNVYMQWLNEMTISDPTIHYHTCIPNWCSKQAQRLQ